MKKIIITFVLVLISFQTAIASSITFQEAKYLASAFFKNKGKVISETSQARMRAKCIDGEEKLPYYIFNAADSEGFVIISNDDNLPAILGYSDNGIFDEEALPDRHPLHSLLQSYARQVSSIKRNGAT